MKIFRSSFSHLVREKIITGLNNTFPPPEERDLPALIPDYIANHQGTFEYDISDRTYSQGVNTYTSQGPMGYGDPPVGSGEKPYYSFLSNKIIPPETNTTLGGQNVYTGNKSIQPRITFKSLSTDGAHATFAFGLANHYVSTSETDYHTYLPETEHVLAAIYGIKTDQSESSHTAVLGSGVLQFCYKNSGAGAKGYEIYLSYRGPAGSNTEQQKVTGSHFYLPYGRLVPITISYDGTSGDVIYRLDSKEISCKIFDLLGDTNGTQLVKPVSGNLGLRLQGLKSSGYTEAYQGLQGPISRLTNVAVNDGSGVVDNSIPPFVVGIPCTGVKSTTSVTDHLPIQISGTGWVPFSDTSADSGYDDDLKSIADVQMIETRGVAASAEDTALEVYTTNASLLSTELTNRGLPALSGVEAINSVIFGATVMDSSNDLKLKIVNNDPGSLTTKQKAFAGIKTDFNDSHLSFFQKFDDSGLVLNDFTNGLVFELEVSDAIVT